MKLFRPLMLAVALAVPCGIAAANNDDGFVWIDANTRIKIKPVSTVKPVPTSAGGGTSAPEKSKTTEKKEKTAK
jgi:hypothetical protein